MTLSLNAARDSSILKPYVEMKLNYNLDTKLQNLIQLKQMISNVNCTKISNFEEQFKIVFERNELENKKKKLQLRLSDEELILFPEYTNAVALLKELGYIDHDERGILQCYFRRIVNTRKLL